MQRRGPFSIAIGSTSNDREKTLHGSPSHHKNCRPYPAAARQSGTRPRSRPTQHKYHSNSFDGRRAAGQFRPPRHADGLGARSSTRYGRTSCASNPTIQSGPNRDRFVLSNGHASMLLYAMLYLTGVKAVMLSTSASVNRR